ncbi:MAG: pyridoxamine 5'-phosphate oxidase family protein [Acidobacteriota bacterium]
MAEKHSIDDDLKEFIEAQQMFFVGTAPRSDDGLVNISPKGLDGTFQILDPTTVAYLDLNGSGIETVAHIRENSRIVFLFCAFDGRPKIVRIHGTAEVVMPGDARWDTLRAHFPTDLTARSIVLTTCRRVATACGFGVPLYEYQGQRRNLHDWADRKGEDGIREYVARKNRLSLDGLPGIDP